ncbi:diguanylate cyclase domain-containing protein [Pseudidiomarina aquimaris]|uniref:diguanylate cyclase domain-containing protein n=1 Tax=Pseudidiomarina aquimaris TaxID=641841 RepID=UPI003A96A617
MAHFLVLLFRIACCLVLSVATVHAAPIKIANDSLYGLHERASILREAPLKWQLDDILVAEQNGLFVPFSGIASSSDRDHAVWLKIQLDTAENFDFSEPRRFLLAHAISQRHADLYIQQGEQWQHVAAGTADGYANSQRLNYRHPAVRLTFDRQPITMYLRFYDPAGSTFPINLLTVGDYTEHYLEENLVFGMVFGAIFALLLYNLILLVQLRDGAYLWYVLSMAAAILLLADGTGLGLQILWPNSSHPWWLGRVSTAAMWGSAILIFSIKFLRLRENLPLVATLLQLTVLLFGLVYLANALGFTRYASIVANSIAMLIIPILLTSAVVRWAQGFKPAIYFVVAQSIMLLAALAMVLRQVGVLNPEDIVSYWFPLAVALEAVLFSLALAHRISELKLQRKEAVLDAQHDSLTELLNRRGMLERLQQRGGKSSYCLVLVDLDGFKPINDRYGHQAGDEVLVCVAKRLKACIRNERNDWVVRFGGDEFGVVLSHSIAHPDAFCERLRQTVEAPMQINDEQISVGASIGFACSDPEESFESLYRRADKELYTDKSARRELAMSVDES